MDLISGRACYAPGGRIDGVNPARSRNVVVAGQSESVVPLKGSCVLMIAVWLSLALWFPAGGSGLTAVSPAAATLQEVSEVEREWDAIQLRVTPKLLAYREASEEERTKITFSRELAEIGSFVRKYSETEPDFSAAARVFLAKEVLSATLGRDQEAVDILRQVAVDAHALVAGFAAIHAAKILTRLGDEDGVKALVESYATRKDNDPSLTQMLRDLERRFALRPGKPFPDLQVESLEGQVHTIQSLRGKVGLFFVFNAVHPASMDCLAQCQLAYKRNAEKGLKVLGLSLDDDPKRLRKSLQEVGVEYPVGWDEKLWKSPTVKLLGISTLPAIYILDPEGKIRFVDIPPTQVASFIDLALEDAREKGTLKDGG